MDFDYDLLERLATTAGVPGREHRIRDLIKEEIDGLADEVSVDAMGSLLAVKKATEKPAEGEPQKVMIAGHMDQIGFMVAFINDQGFLYLNSVGGFDTRNLFARLVRICPDPTDPSKDLTGILNAAVKPVHIASPEDRKKVPELREFVIDLGLPVEEVKEKVKIGDMVVLSAEVNRLGPHVVSQCLDNRIAVWVLIETLKQLAGQDHTCDVYAAFTVQEEVGLRGATAASYAVKPDVAIGLDTTLAVDTPGTGPHEACTRLGEGAAITVMDSSAIGDYDLIETFDRLSKENDIKSQRSILSRGGTDTGGMQRTAGGCRAMTLSCPTRYIHTVTEMIHTGDLNACRDLLTAYLKQA